MKKKTLTYKQSVDLVVTHIKETKDQWQHSEHIRRTQEVSNKVDPVSGLFVQGYSFYCCPITSLANKHSDEWSQVGKAFKLDKRAMEDIVTAADTTLFEMKHNDDPEIKYTKAQIDLRKRMERIFNL